MAAPPFPLPNAGASDKASVPGILSSPTASPAPAAGAAPAPPHSTTAGLGETKGTFIDWVATNNPRLGGLCPGEIALSILLVFTVLVFVVSEFIVRLPPLTFLYNFSVPMSALATAWAALEVWRNLRQIERTDEGSMTPHLWLLGTQQARLIAPTHTPSSVTGLHELFLHNYGPGLAVDVRIIVDGKMIDRVPYVAPGKSVQVGGALHGHGMEGTHQLSVVYNASSGREHRMAGTLLRDRDMEEIVFRSDLFNHVYSVA